MSLVRKLRKLRRDPVGFVRDLVAKRLGRVDRQVADSLEAARATLRRHARPMVVAYHPVARDNPYQRVLYSAAAARGAAAIPVRRLEDLVAAECDETTVCHLHWLTDVVGPAASDADARTRIAQFTRQLDVLARAGAKVAWTVHNVLPHSATRRDLEIQLRREVIARADAIHVMTERTFDETRALYDIPRRKTFVCPHPAYDGVYPDTVTRAEARAQLDVPDDATVFLAFGSIQAYKGLRALAAAAADIGPDAVLVIAGVPTDAHLAAALHHELGASGSIRLHMHRISDSRVQTFYRAADYAVCAHHAVLNSGAALLALSFGVPIVGPRTGALAELIDAGCGIGFDLGDAATLTGALRNALAADPARFRAAIDERRALMEPAAVSSAFFDALRAQLGR